MKRVTASTCLLVVIAMLCWRGAMAHDQTALPNLAEAEIPMQDGVRLAADLYLPPGATDQSSSRYPVLLEYLPYRKNDSRDRNWRMYRYFTERGYVVARVDIRGTGNSAGHIVPMEYSDQELDDGEVVINWLAQQPWSTGKVGMFGVSWGGFNGLQLALRNPPALKAVVAVDATEDLYQDDVHFIDGILHVDSWEMSQDLDNARPGAPDYRIDQQYFEDRFDTPPWMLTYKRHQHDDAFWDRASMKGKYAQVRVPIFHIGGWYDGYRNSIPRMLQNLKAPTRAIVGPWSHGWPHEPYPNPGIEWRHEAVRWFDTWLQGKDTGILKEPKLAVYMRNWHAPGPNLDTVPGSWRWIDQWPIPHQRSRTWYADDHHALQPHAGKTEQVHALAYVPSTGVEAGGPVMWWGDVAPDQRGTDAFSLTYDSAMLDQDVPVLGLPLALLRVATTGHRANWIVRMEDVAPDGSVTLVTGAAINGAQRQSARQPTAMVPGRYEDLRVTLHFTSWVFGKGHRIRFAINNAQWPMLWPSAEPMTTMLKIGGAAGARFVVPILPASQTPGPTFLAPEPSAGLPDYVALDTGTSSGFGEISSVERNPVTGEASVRATNEGGMRYPWGTESYHETIVHRTSDRDPAHTSVVGSYRMQVETAGRVLRWESDVTCSSDASDLDIAFTRRLFENDVLIRTRSWRERIPRDFQ